MIALRFQAWSEATVVTPSSHTVMGQWPRAVSKAASHTYSCYCTWTATALKVNRSSGIRNVATRDSVSDAAACNQHELAD